MKCEMCKQDFQVLHNYYNDEKGGFETLCPKCFKKKVGAK